MSDIERRLSELEQEVQRLNRRIENMLSRKGGYVEGQVHLNGWLQLEAVDVTRRPESGNVKLQAANAGGVLQVFLRFPSGRIIMLGQDT